MPARNRAQPGNQLATKHGGHALVPPVEVQAVMDAIRPVLPVQHQGDELALSELADVLIRLHRFRRYLDENDPWQARSRVALSKVRSAMRWEDRYSSRVQALLKELGLTPAARAKLGLNLMRQVNLAEAMSERDPVKRRALLAAAGVPEEDGSDG